MPGTTPTLALPYPVPADTIDVPRDVKALADKLDAGSPAAIQSTAGGTATSVPANGAAFVLIPVGATETASGTANEFVRNADGTITIVQAGWYSMSFYINCSGLLPNHRAQYRICTGAANAVPTTANTLTNDDVYGGPVGAVGCTPNVLGKFAANTRFGVFAVQDDTVVRDFVVYRFGIARQ